MAEPDTIIVARYGDTIETWPTVAEAEEAMSAISDEPDSIWEEDIDGDELREFYLVGGHLNQPDMTTNDALGDRMKRYEGAEAQRRLLPLLPICARIDGRAFHTFTRGLHRPFDERLVQLMIRTTEHLVRETGAVIGYTQSDEISLVFYSEDYESQVFFDGRVQKMTSMLAAMTSVYFNRCLADAEFLPEKRGAMPVFDCRVWNVPNLTEATNYLLWREIDATKNSIQMLARAHFSHKRLHGKNGSEMQEMLWSEKHINWNDLPDRYKRGTYVRRVKTSRPFTAEEIETLPERHEARRNPDLVVERSVIGRLDMPPLRRITNRVDVLFHGAEPITETVAQIA